MVEDCAEPKTNNNVHANNWKWIRISLLIAPPLGYLLAYTHELGYCNVFKIPKELILLDWTTVIVGVSATFGASLLLVWFITMLFLPMQSKRPMGPIKRRLYFFFLVFVFTLLFSYKYLIVKEVIYPIAYLVALAVFLFLIPIFTKDAKEAVGYRNKLAAYDELQRKSEAPFFKRVGLKELVLFIFLIGIFPFSYLGGRATAINQDEFYVPSTYPNSVVLRIYGDRLICAQLNKERREVERTYFILRTNDEPRPMLIATNTGRLHIRE